MAGHEAARPGWGGGGPPGGVGAPGAPPLPPLGRPAEQRPAGAERRGAGEGLAVRAGRWPTCSPEGTAGQAAGFPAPLAAGPGRKPPPRAPPRPGAGAHLSVTGACSGVRLREPCRGGDFSVPLLFLSLFLLFFFFPFFLQAQGGKRGKLPARWLHQQIRVQGDFITACPLATDSMLEANCDISSVLQTFLRACEEFYTSFFPPKMNFLRKVNRENDMASSGIEICVDQQRSRPGFRRWLKFQSAGVLCGQRPNLI